MLQGETVRWVRGLGTIVFGLVGSGSYFYDGHEGNIQAKAPVPIAGESVLGRVSSGQKMHVVRGDSPEPISQTIDRVERENGIPRGILAGVIFIESGYNEDVTRDEPHLCRKHGWPRDYCRSYGLTQVIYGYHWDRCELSSPAELKRGKKSVECGGAVLGDYIKRFGVTGGLSAFNGDRSGKYARKVMSVARKMRV